MKRKKIARLGALLLSAVLLVLTLGACTQETKEQGRIQVVATIFPAYDWTMQVVGDNPADMDVRLLLDNGVDLHSYQPSVDDIMLIANCDVFIYVGGESDEWVEDIQQQTAKEDRQVICLMDELGTRILQEEEKEGMEKEDHEEEAENDEHIWLSLKNAAFFCEKISETLGNIDSAHAADYRSHAKAYQEKLTALDQRYAETVQASPSKTLLFGDRFPFRYLTDDYGLTYYAAFSGCSAETEASFETIVFLAGKVDELGLKTILTTESTDGSVARTVKENTKTKDQAILALDSMQSVTSEQMKNGTTYLSVMEKNADVLRQALA